MLTLSLAIKSRFNDVEVIPNYPCDDEGIPTSTAGGDKGDIECYEGRRGILIEVTMTEGSTQTRVEVWPIARHLEDFKLKINDSMCYFIAPTIFIDSQRQINWLVTETRNTSYLKIIAKTINDFVNLLEEQTILYS